jgi:tRNA(His) 5'-end guanylyltransferase
MKNDSFGNRMKKYENVQRVYLTRRMSTIIRLDGKAFHSFTRHFQKPFDGVLMKTMWDTAQYLCENIMGCKIAYTQSDEITLLLTDYDNLDTEAWFDKNVQKISSVSAGMDLLILIKYFLIMPVVGFVVLMLLTVLQMKI